MKVVKRSIAKVSKGIVTKMIAKDAGDWPPYSTVFVYQPKRPEKISDLNVQEKNHCGKNSN